MKKELAKREKEVMDFLVSYKQAHKRTPSVNQIMKEVGITSRTQVHQLLKNMKIKGWVDIKLEEFRIIIK